MDGWMDGFDSGGLDYVQRTGLAVVQRYTQSHSTAVGQ